MLPFFFKGLTFFFVWPLSLILMKKKAYSMLPFFFKGLTFFFRVVFISDFTLKKKGEAVIFSCAYKRKDNNSYLFAANLLVNRYPLFSILCAACIPCCAYCSYPFAAFFFCFYVEGIPNNNQEEIRA